MMLASDFDFINLGSFQENPLLGACRRACSRILESGLGLNPEATRSNQARYMSTCCICMLWPCRCCGGADLKVTPEIEQAVCVDEQGHKLVPILSYSLGLYKYTMISRMDLYTTSFPLFLRWHILP